MDEGGEDCAPNELAASEVNLDFARHEATETWESARALFCHRG